MLKGWKGTIGWLTTPQNHDYPAAKSYLRLLFDESTASRFLKRLRNAKIIEFKAKDILRASRLSLLGVSNSHVKKDKQKIERGQDLSPLLLVRDTRSQTDYRRRLPSALRCLHVRRRRRHSVEDCVSMRPCGLEDVRQHHRRFVSRLLNNLEEE